MYVQQIIAVNPAVRSDTAMAYVPPITSNNIQYDQLIIYYNTLLYLNRTITTLDMFDSNSNTMYNCTIYDNEVVVSTQLNTVQCIFSSFAGSPCEHHNYILCLSAIPVNPTTDTYIIIHYRWIGGFCSSYKLMTRMLALLLLSVVAIGATIFVLPYMSNICFDFQQCKKSIYL